MTPGSTHADTLVALIEELRKAGAKEFTVGDRSGMGKTREVMEATEAFRIAKDLRTKTLVFDELADSDWELFKSDSMKWPRGFLLPKPVLRADAIVQTCCLKTHRFGGHFTLSLKNSVGFAARRIQGDPYDFMRELHSSSDYPELRNGKFAREFPRIGANRILSERVRTNRFSKLCVPIS
ncbi:MAG: DUF362 domain-containing protein [Acidobacteria bacterium]|nr:DUF362 domain-containing protein [Acidobacteriota bacterium]